MVTLNLILIVFVPENVNTVSLKLQTNSFKKVFVFVVNGNR